MEQFPVSEPSKKSEKENGLKRIRKWLGFGALVAGAAIGADKLSNQAPKSEEPGAPMERPQEEQGRQPTLEVDSTVVQRREREKALEEKRFLEESAQKEAILKEAAQLSREEKIKRWEGEVNTPIDVFSDYAGQFQERRDYPIEKQKEVEDIIRTYIQQEVADKIKVYLELLEGVGQAEAKNEAIKKLSQPIELLRRKGYELPSAAEFLR